MVGVTRDTGTESGMKVNGTFNVLSCPVIVEILLSDPLDVSDDPTETQE